MSRLAYLSLKSRLLGHVIDFFVKVIFRTFKSKSLNLHVVKTLAIIKLDHLGDGFLFLPFFEFLKSSYPNLKITYFGQTPNDKLFCEGQSPDEFVSVDWRRSRKSSGRTILSDAKYLAELIKKNGPYDVIIDARGELVCALAMFLTGTKNRVGIRGEEVGTFFYQTFFEWDGVGHESQKNIQLLKALNVNVRTLWLPRVTVKLPLSQEFRSPLPYLVVHPFAGYAYKMLSVTQWSQFLTNLLTNLEKQYQVFILGTISESTLSETLALNLGESGFQVKSLAGKLKLRELGTFLSEAKAFIGHDSFPGHVAGVLGINTHILMNGKVDPVRWKPLGEKVSLYFDLEASHLCRLDGCHEDCPHMLKIDQSKAITNIIKTLSF